MSVLGVSIGKTLIYGGEKPDFALGDWMRAIRKQGH